MTKFLALILLSLSFSNISHAGDLLCGHLAFQNGVYVLQNAGLTRDGEFRSLDTTIQLSLGDTVEDRNHLLEGANTPSLNACAAGAFEGDTFEATAVWRGLNPYPGVTVNNKIAAAALETSLQPGRCEGEQGKWLGGISIDYGCPSGRSFSSHDVRPACIEYSGNLGTGAYLIQGILCHNGTIEVLSARPQLIH